MSKDGLTRPDGIRDYEFHITICVVADNDRDANLYLEEYVRQEGVLNDIDQVIITGVD